jgi:subtilisin family serine protease
MGAIIVAAAGNDSPGRDKNNQIVDPMPMLAPAVFDNVIGVAAINKNGQRSCYSNKGDIAAPGGDGGPGQNPDGTPNPCVPRANTWNQPDPSGIIECNQGAENCRFGVISLVMTDTGPQYALWSGTSFATPIVSGLAALAYAKWDQTVAECLIKKGVQPVTSTPKWVEWGIMDMNKALTDSTILSTCRAAP